MARLFPDPFQDHPSGCWEAQYRPKAECEILNALTRFRDGSISESELRQDKNKDGIKFWLWYMHHPPHDVWKKIGRPYWSIDAYESWRRRYLATAPEKRSARGGWPSPLTIPNKAANDDWIIHEHVVPQRVSLDLLIRMQHPVADVVKRNIGAVITKREDRRIVYKDTHPDPTDPWLRYKGLGIRFLPNPRWTPTQEEALRRYDLIASVDIVQQLYEREGGGELRGLDGAQSDDALLIPGASHSAASQTLRSRSQG